MERGIRQEEAAAAGHTWQALTEGKGLPEQDGGESQVARIEIPQPSLELGFTPVAMKMAPASSKGFGACLLSEKHPGAQLQGGSRVRPIWGLFGESFPLLPRPSHPRVLPRGDIREGRRLAGGKLRQDGGCLSPFHGFWHSQPQLIWGPGS